MYVYNKVDTITIEEVDKLAREPHSVVISVHAKLNLDYMLAKMWEHMGLIRIYTKKRGMAPDLVSFALHFFSRPSREGHLKYPMSRCGNFRLNL